MTDEDIEKLIKFYEDMIDNATGADALERFLLGEYQKTVKALRHLRDKVKALREEAEEVRSDYDLLATEMVYSGNSVQHWCQKAKAYKAVIGEMWDVLKKHGIQPDGQTSCVDAMDAALQDGREQ